MAVTALSERIELSPALAEQMMPSTQLTPIQMAYQLMANGHDLAKAKELIAFGKELEADEAKKAFNIAMAEAQAEMLPVATNANNTQTRSKYATYDQLDRALRPIYTRHGFGLSFDEADSPKPDCIRVVCEVTHRAGHTKIYHRDMPADGKGAKGGDVMTKTHAAGAAASYGMRYILRGIFNVAVGEGDTDGNVPDGSPPLTENQILDLQALVEEFGANPKLLCQRLKVQYLDDLPQSRLKEAEAMIRAKGARA